MLNKLQQRKDAGFTIIEVMIVLAIAGLIMLIVFLAVPALQRNSHNTSIKNDVAGLLAGMNEATNNNNGTAPTSLANGSQTAVDITNSSVTGYNKATVKLGYVDGSALGATITKLSGTANAVTTAGTVKLYTNAVCSGNGATSTNATTRNYVALFALEGGASLCQES